MQPAINDLVLLIDHNNKEALAIIDQNNKERLAMRNCRVGGIAETTREHVHL